MGGGVGTAPQCAAGGPFLSPRSLSLPLTRLSRRSPSRAMASALSYVSKFKSFVILFITPLLLLPLVILMPAKVSRISADPGSPVPAAGANPGALSWSAELGVHSGAPGARWEVPAKHFKGHGDPGAHRPWGSQIPGRKNPPGEHWNLEVSSDLGHTAHP